jgi:serine/threonine protein kinase
MGFQITQVLETGLEGKRLLYLATTDRDQKKILLKFSRWYSKNLHMFCASIKHAPELLAFERLPGGWFGVAMEYFPSADRIVDSKDLCDYGEKWLKDIDTVVKQFHAQGYVHGDLRPPNFIVNDGRLFLIDFDWGGKEGEATFPRKRLHPILRDGRRDTRITKEHDKRVIEFTRWHINEAIKRLQNESKSK